MKKKHKIHNRIRGGCDDGRHTYGRRSAEVGIVVDLFLDAHKHSGVPLIEPRYAIVHFHSFGERVNVLLL